MLAEWSDPGWVTSSERWSCREAKYIWLLFHVALYIQLQDRAAEVKIFLKIRVDTFLTVGGQCLVLDLPGWVRLDDMSQATGVSGLLLRL